MVSDVPPGSVTVKIVGIVRIMAGDKMEKAEVIRWLNKYHELTDYYASSKFDFCWSEPYFESRLDGLIKKIIIDQALEWMPERYAECVRSRYIDFKDKLEIMRRYKISQATYYRWLGIGVDKILEFIEYKKTEFLLKNA